MSTVATTLPPMLSDEMRTDLDRAGTQQRKWTDRRDRLIREAVASGASLREVGAAVGMSHTAVKFIAHGRPSKA